jgi:uncharacterized protein YndB with AHSA1/START domain
MTGRRTVVLERTYPAPPEVVWTMWTTADGIESWWGPDGFSVEVHEIDVVLGGALRYSMRAVGTDQVEAVTAAGLGTVTTHDIVFTEVDPPRRLSYTTVVDFIPGTEPYEAGTSVELAAVEEGTRLTLTLEAMHDQHWTDLAVMGWESELDRLHLALRKEPA